MTIPLHISAIFKEISNSSGLLPQNIINSLDGEKNKEQIEKMAESLGKSGAIFMTTHDKKFIIKSINKNDVDVIVNKLGVDYYAHIKNNPQTLLAKIYGSFTVKIEIVKDVNFILMENSFSKLGIPDKIFDVKGSTRNRKAKPHSKVGMDLNLLREINSISMREI